MDHSYQTKGESLFENMIRLLVHRGNNITWVIKQSDSLSVVDSELFQTNKLSGLFLRDFVTSVSVTKFCVPTSANHSVTHLSKRLNNRWGQTLLISWAVNRYSCWFFLYQSAQDDSVVMPDYDCDGLWCSFRSKHKAFHYSAKKKRILVNNSQKGNL